MFKRNPPKPKMLNDIIFDIATVIAQHRTMIAIYSFLYLILLLLQHMAASSVFA